MTKCPFPLKVTPEATEVRFRPGRILVLKMMPVLRRAEKRDGKTQILGDITMSEN